MGHLVAVDGDDGLDFGAVGALLFEFLTEFELDGGGLEQGRGGHGVLVAVEGELDDRGGRVAELAGNEADAWNFGKRALAMRQNMFLMPLTST